MFNTSFLKLILENILDLQIKWEKNDCDDGRESSENECIYTVTSIPCCVTFNTCFVELLFQIRFDFVIHKLGLLLQ